MSLGDGVVSSAKLVLITMIASAIGLDADALVGLHWMQLYMHQSGGGASIF
jgi:hypothetical protein